jgi:hypothetical protein
MSVSKNRQISALNELGQSVWYDNLSRDVLRSGELKSLIDQGVSGLTSNPTIFKQAIADTTNYDDDMKSPELKALSTEALCEELMLKDVAAAADLLRPIYDATGAGDGTATANWDKSHIFRVPITEGYPFAVRLSEESADRLFAFTPQGARAKNLYRLTDGSYTTTDPRRPELITRIYYGGHDIFLTDPEITELTAAGYGSSIT